MKTNSKIIKTIETDLGTTKILIIHGWNKFGRCGRRTCFTIHNTGWFFGTRRDFDRLDN